MTQSHIERILVNKHQNRDTRGFLRIFCILDNYRGTGLGLGG